MGDSCRAVEITRSTTCSDKAWLDALFTDTIEIHACMAHTTGKDFGFTERIIDQQIVNFMLDGTMRAQIGNEHYQLGPGSVIWVAAGVPHSFHLAQPGRGFSMLNTRWRIQQRTRFLRPPEDVIVHHDRWDLRALFEMMIDEHQHPAAQPERLLKLLYLIYTDLHRQSAPLGRRQRLHLHELIRQQPAERPTPSDLADVIGLSPDYFRRVFNRTFGCSPKRWLLRERIFIASERLQESPHIRIGDLAEELGYTDLALFSRQFNDVIGMSPSAYRNQIRWGANHLAAESTAGHSAKASSP
jgi:AraC-like DNA-binding protein